MGDTKHPFLKKDDTAGPTADVDRDKQVEDALDAADDASNKVDDAVVKKAEAEAEVSELFDKTEEDAVADDDGMAEAAVADEDGTNEALFDEPDKVPKGWTEKTYRRFQKVIGQRNDGRRLNAAQAKTIAQSEEFMRTLGGKYASYDNPTAVMRADADFMDAFEQLAKTTPSIAAIADQVKNFQSTGDFPVADGQPIAKVDLRKEAAATAKPQNDPRVSQLIEQGARNTISATLTELKVKPVFQKIITDALIAKGDDLSTISRDGVIAQAKAFISENGLSASEVLTQVASPPAKDKPATGRQKQAAVSDKPSQESEDNTSKAPQTREQWLENRNKMRDEMFRE